ncbi:MAG: aspartate-semialdehyde dehydrogenase [Verrucomicrobiota bacterium]
MNATPHIAIAGATGAVGEEMLQCLAERDFPLRKLTLLASARSAGKTLSFRGESIEIQELTRKSFSEVDIALFSAGGEISREFAPAAAEAGAVVIDNSSAFRMQEDVPLVIPEVNPEDALQHPRGLIANPNCTTIVTLMALAPLHRAFGVKQVIASSYQAVSGSGAKGIAELESQIVALAQNQAIVPSVYPRQIVSNVIPLVESLTENGYTKEEMKMQNEGRKILHHSLFRASVTCVRVPVHRSHAISVTADFKRPVTVEGAREALRAAKGIEVVDDREKALFPTPLDTTGRDACQVGRIRSDLVFENGLSLWVVGDQVRKGAALNAVQIAELLLPEG